MIDCDVLQADGGTRTASITGACVALRLAIQNLLKSGKLQESPLVDSVSAISIGMKNGLALLDLDYSEDSTCDVDMNFVITGTGKLVEVQGTAEKIPFTKADLDQMTNLAFQACEKLAHLQLSAVSL